MKRDLRDSERNETTTTMEQNSFENVTNGLASSTSPRAQERRDAFKKLRQSRQSEKSMDFDDLLPHVGEFGRYQKLLIFLICLPACIPCGFHAFNQLFMSPSPPHWCRVPELEGLGLTVQEVRNLSIPWEGGGYSQCSQYQLPNNYTPEWPLEEPRPAWPVVPCTSGWIYNTTIIYSSIVIDYDLVCDKAIFPTVGLSVLNVGGIIGVYVFGTISRWLGRRISFLVCLGIEQVFGLITAFAPNFWAWLTCRFLVGLTVPAIYQIPFIISLELVGPSYRSFVTVMTCLFYVGGMLLLAGVAYLVRNWVYLCLVTSLPFFVYVVYWWYLPESPRWLLSKGRLQEARTILTKMAEVNKTELPDSFMQKLQDRMMAQQALSTSSAQKNSATGFFSMCYTPNMRLKAILITMVWFANETVYVGLSYYGPAMGDDEYLSFFLSCAVEVPSYLLCWIVMDRWGRRWILGVGMIIGGIFSICTVLMPEGASLATLVLYLVAKFSESAAFLIIYPFAAELYPTEVRGVGIGFSAYVGGLGLVIIPFINYLGTEMLVLPLLIMGVVSALGGVLTFRLPETLQQKLPNTMAEGEAFGHDFSWQECWACVPEIKQKEYEDFDHASDEEIDEIVSLENLGRRRSSEGHGRPDEATPLQRFGPLGSRANPLIRQTSIMDTPIITDASGAMKLTFWV
ncbi:carcinine transporter-like [Homarus americanus]|uniref:carcinine transporter-like n=1 Tax=Homarus americanus TaxID=6706 RepID=UPI001C488D13|nr:carcinine transporter-like [Homarus americanus]